MVGLEGYTDYYREKFEEGMEYQDFAMEVLLEKMGIPISCYSSKKYQHSKGENKQGIEIKNDLKYAETGNLFIETAEKTKAENANFIKSGIYRDDNSWLYLIGDYKTIFIFGIETLKGIHKTKKCKEVEIPTSQGFLLGLNHQKYALKKIEI